MLTFLGFGGLVFEFWSIHEATRELERLFTTAEDHLLEMTEAEDRMIQALRMAVFTNDPLWRNQASAHQETLHESIHELESVLPEMSEGQVQRLHEHANSLQQMAQTSLMLLNRNLLGDARNVVFGEEFRAEQNDFAQATNVLAQLIRTSESEQLETVFRRTIRAGVAGTLILASIFLISLYAFLSIRQWQRKLEGTISRHQKLQEELEKHRDQVLRRSESKERFVAQISHEIRTPMSGIIGMVQLLQQTKMDKDQAFYCETIRKSGRHMLSLISDILDHARIEAGKMQFDAEDFDLEECISEVLDMLAGSAGAKEIELVEYVDPGIHPLVVGDEKRIRQVLTNLISNAIKFTPRGGEVAVSVRMIKSPQNRSRFYFEVRDTGIGIAREKQSRLFRPFEQAETSTTTKYGGSGLGLHISREIVEEMGGEIGVRSETGKGSTFWFTVSLPRQEGQAKPRDYGDTPLKGRNLLLVVERGSIRAPLEEYTRRMRMNVRTENSIEGAAAVLGELSGGPLYPHIILLATNHPANDSLPLAGILSELPGTPPAVVACTHINSQRQKLRDALPNAVILQKPLSRRKLFDGMLKALSVLTNGNTGQHQPAAPVPVDPAQSAETDANQGEAGTRKRLNILIVEDDPVNQRVMSLQIQTLGQTPDLARDGEEALRMCERKPYHLIFLDCQLPGISGLETARRLRARTWLNPAEMGEGLPRIAATTAHILEEERRESFEAGMDEHLTKPVDFEEIKRVVADALVRMSRAQANGEPTGVSSQPESGERENP